MSQLRVWSFYYVVKLMEFLNFIKWIKNDLIYGEVLNSGVGQKWQVFVVYTWCFWVFKNKPVPFIFRITDSGMLRLTIIGERPNFSERILIRWEQKKNFFSTKFTATFRKQFSKRSENDSSQIELTSNSSNSKVTPQAITVKFQY